MNAVGDREGCRLENGVVRTPEGFRAAYAAVADGGWIGIDLDPAFGGQGMPHVLEHRRRRDARRREHGAQHVLGPEPRRLQRHPRPRIRGAEGRLPAAPRLRRLVRHDEPDRAALRHRPRAAPDPRRAAARRQLSRHRAEDLHLRRRARPRRQHRAPGAGAHSRRPGGRKGHLALHRAEVPAEGRRRARGAQRPLLRQDRGEDGHPRQRHLRDELRRGDRVAGRRAAQGPARHVHHDERGAPLGRGAGPRPGRGRLPGGGGLRPRPAAGPRGDRPGEPGRPGRSPDRASRRPPGADGRPRLRRRRPRADALGRDPDRPPPAAGRRGGGRVSSRS